MKKTVLTILFTLLVFMAQGEVFRMGVLGAVESPSEESDIVNSLFEDQDNVFSGLYWEVRLAHMGLGMTYLAKFDEGDSLYSGEDWNFHWNGSFDFRYHFFRDFFVDPFLEFNVGCAGMMNLSGDYEAPFYLSLYSQAGYGLAFVFDDVHFGGKISHRVFNEIPPVTPFEPYPFESVQFAYFIGFSI